MMPRIDFNYINTPATYIMLALFSIIILLSIIYLYSNPTLCFIPYNFLVEWITPKKVFYTQEEKYKIFPQAKIFEKHTKTIRKEALGILDQVRGNVSENYIKTEKKFYEGWTTFPIRLFGKNTVKGAKMCPKLSSILERSPDVVTAFFSIVEPGGKIEPHYGPFKGILRYHLGLVIPPAKSGDCFISVDGIKYFWKKGQGVLFDESYLHYVQNDTPHRRIILFLDLKRPFASSLMNQINDVIIDLIGISPHNQKALIT